MLVADFWGNSRPAPYVVASVATLHEVYQVVSQIAVTDSAKNSVIKLGAGPCDIIDLLLAC
jgi:hypothetical protein